MDHRGGLNLSGSQGRFRKQLEAALEQIARARLPDGSRPVLVGCLEFIRKTLTVRTNILFGELPWDDRHPHLVFGADRYEGTEAPTG